MKTTKNGKSSICDWQLEVSFLTKDQASAFIKLYLDSSDIPIQFAYFVTDDEKHVITIDGKWAENIVNVGELLKQVDHKLFHDDSDEIEEVEKEPVEFDFVQIDGLSIEQCQAIQKIKNISSDRRIRVCKDDQMKWLEEKLFEIEKLITENF